MLRAIWSLVLLCTAAVAQAEWKEATTEHFVVYSDMDAAKLKAAAENLERYDYLLRIMLDLPKQHPLKVRVYLLGDAADVGRSLGYSGDVGIGGYYIASARGPMAVGMRKSVGDVESGVDGETVLLHEYAHHLMLQHSQAAYPMWYVEGFAEYYGTTRILPDSFEVGQMAPFRRAWFKDGGQWLPLKELLTARNYKDIDNQVGLLYAQGWLLVHYLSDNPQRSGQLRRYLTMVNAGVDYKKAMDAAFGADAKDLDAELRRYSRRQQLPALRISFKNMSIGPVTVKSLSAARSAMMDLEIELGRGLYAKDAAKFAQAVRAKAKDYPDDPSALGLLTFAERYAGNLAAADAAGDRWRAAAPNEPRAYLLKGLIAIDRLTASKSKETSAWVAARAFIEKAKALAPQEPLVLEGYYDSYAASGVLPPPVAQNALVSALELVPQDDVLRYRVAYDLEQRGYIEDALLMIMPAALNAHQSDDENEKQKARREKRAEKWRLAGAAKTETAREMLARLQAKMKTASAATAGTPPQ